MSTWSLGTEPVGRAEFMGGNGIKSYIDRVTKWIPGDVLAIYAAGITVLADAPNAEPSVTWLAVMLVATPAIVILGAYATGHVRREHAVRAGLAVVAFLIWSTTVPFSGWQRWDLLAGDSGFITVLAGLAGLLFGLLAEGITRRTPAT